MDKKERIPHYAPPLEPSYNREQALRLLPILEARPSITYQELLLDYPEISLEVLTKGLLGFFDDYLKQTRTRAENISMGSMIEAARQLEAARHPDTMQAFSETERDEVLTLAAASLAEEIQNKPAGLALLFTTEAAMNYQRQEADRQRSLAKPKGKHLAGAAQSLSRYSILTDAISRNLPKLQPAENEVYVGKGAAGKGHRRDISSVVTLDFPQEIQVENGQVLSSYDKAILNGISSLLLAGVKYFTIPMLYHAMTAVENPSMDAAAIENLGKRLELMRRSFITIDYTDEAAAHFIQMPVEGLTIENYLLPMSRIEAVLNGRQVTAYHVLTTPPLHQYATLKRQLSLVRMDLLNAPLNNNATTIPLKNYILGRIEGMNNPHNRLVSDKILFQSIFEELGEPEPTKLRRKRIRDYTETFLNYLTQEQYIDGYEMTRNGRTIDGVVIRLKGKNRILLAEKLEQSAQPQKNKIKPKKRG